MKIEEKKIINFKHIYSISEEIMGKINVDIDITNQLDIKIIKIYDKEEIKLLTLHHSIYMLTGIILQSFLKEEHIDFVQNNLVKEIPTEWQETIYIDNLNIEESLQYNEALFPAFPTVKNEYYINNKLIPKKEISMEMLKERTQKMKESEITIQHQLNNIYNNLKEQSNELLGIKEKEKGCENKF